MKEYEDLGDMEPVKSQEGKTTCYFYHIIQSSVKQVLQQVLGMHLVEVPSLVTAPNNKTDKSQPGTDFSIILAWIQGPLSKWKTSVGNSRHHSRRKFFSNTETCAISIHSCWSHFKGNWAFNTSTPWRKGPHMSSQELSSWPTTEVTTTDNLEIRSTCCASTT